MQTGTIVSRRAGTFPPNAFWEAVLAANPHGWGAAMVNEEGLLLNTSDVGCSLEEIQETLKTFEDKNITFYFANSEGGVSEKDLSPHIILVKMDGEEEIPQVVVFADGNFPTYAKTSSSHPPEYHMVMEYLQPKLEAVYELCDGDLDKVFVQLEKPFFKKELLLTSVSRGHITLVLANGRSLTYSQPDNNSGEFPWGWASNTHGYVEGKKKEAAPEKKPSMFSGKSTVREKAPTQPSTAIAEAVAAPATGGAAIKNYNVIKDRPPGHLSRKDRKQWYQSRIGYAPPEWERCCSIEFYTDAHKKLVTWAEIKRLGLGAAALPPLKNPVRGTDTETDNIEHEPVSGAGEEQPIVTAEVLPIMSPDTRKHIQKIMADKKTQKIVAGNAELIMDPAIVQSLEAKFADFARQVGAKSIDEFLLWDYEQFRDLGKEKPDGLAVMAWSFRNIIAYHRTKKVEKVEEPVTTEAPPKVKRPSMFAKAVA